MAKKQIVILGAGFGGLAVAQHLAKQLRRQHLLDRYEILLIDKNEHHTYTPLLYEVATTSKDIASITALHTLATFPIQTLIPNPPVVFLRSEIAHLNLQSGFVLMKEGKRISYDYVVLALGSETNYFDIQGLEKFALPFKSFKDAIAIRDTIWELAESGKAMIRVMIGGAGPTGVELTGELETWRVELKKEFPHSTVATTLLEGAPSVLPGFAPRIQRKVMQRLHKLGVEVRAGAMLKSVSFKEVLLSSSEVIPFDVLVWTGGVKASRLVATAPLKSEGKGRIEVMNEMECLTENPDLELRAKVYAIGDIVCFHDPKTQKPIQGIAPVAIEQAQVVATNIFEEIKTHEGITKTPRRARYTPKEYPYVVPVGGKYAVAKIGPFIFSGYLGWIFKGLVELYYLFSIMRPGQALRVWLKGLKIFMQNDRLG